MHLQFKPTFFGKIQESEKKLKKYTKKQRKCPKFEHVGYDNVLKLQKKIVPKNKKQKIFYRVSSVDTRQSNFFAKCQTSATRQSQWYQVPSGLDQSLPSDWLCRVPNTRQRQHLPSVSICQVPGTRSSLPNARNLALGEIQVSRSVQAQGHLPISPYTQMRSTIVARRKRRLLGFVGMVAPYV